MASTRSINYSVRAGKHVERHMILEALQRLDRLPPRLDSYRYVGFGGIFFTDFLLAHRHLGLNQMTSIEKSQPARFDFNRPLSCIDLRFGSSSEVLPSVLEKMRKAKEPGVFWLDYDGSVKTDVTADVALVAAQAAPLTVVMVTVNCEPLQARQDRVPQLRGQLGDEMPPEISHGAQLGGWKLAEVSHRIISGSIERSLLDRNLALESGDRIRYRQLFRFHYSDGARMLTLGGILHTDSQIGIVADAFAGLGQLRASHEEPLAVEVPVLTAREVRHLLEQLPVAAVPDEIPPDVTSPGVPAADVQKFVDVYRYYPLYAEIGPQ